MTANAIKIKTAMAIMAAPTPQEAPQPYPYI